MKRLVPVILVWVLLLSGCSKYVENIEVTTLNTEITVEARKTKATEPLKTEDSTSEMAGTTTSALKSEELTNSEAKSSETVDESTTSTEVELSSSEISEESTTSDVAESTTKKDFLNEIQNVPVSDLVEDAQVTTTERVLSSEGADDVDIDLTMLNSTMRYSQLYNMMMNASDYLGQKIRIEGMYISDVIDDNTTYHFVVVVDEAACCQQGMEFILDEGLTYPQTGTNIRLKGEFKSYMEGDNEWFYLQVDSVE